MALPPGVVTSPSVGSSQVSGGGFIRANSHVGLAIICQSVVAEGQPQARPSSAKIVKDVDTKRLGALPTAAGGIARLIDIANCVAAGLSGSQCIHARIQALDGQDASGSAHRTPKTPHSNPLSVEQL